MEVVPEFPLLSLPRPAILNTLEILDLLHVFGISLLSKKTKDLVKSLKLKSCDLRISITGTIVFSLTFPTGESLFVSFYEVGHNQPLQEVQTPETISVGFHDHWPEWNNSICAKKLLDHLREIFHSPKQTVVFIRTCERFNLESLHKSVRYADSVELTTNNLRYNIRVLSLFQPKNVKLGRLCLLDGRVPRNILIQNQFFLETQFISVRVTLDDLLLTNIRRVQMVCDGLSEKSFNKFLKLWINGSNSQLEYLGLAFPAGFLAENILRGITYQLDPHEEVFDGINVECDIWRFDGTKASITMKRMPRYFKFFMHVMHDHCTKDQTSQQHLYFLYYD